MSGIRCNGISLYSPNTYQKNEVISKLENVLKYTVYTGHKPFDLYAGFQFWTKYWPLYDNSTYTRINFYASIFIQKCIQYNFLIFAGQKYCCKKNQIIEKNGKEWNNNKTIKNNNKTNQIKTKLKLRFYACNHDPTPLALKKHPTNKQEKITIKNLRHRDRQTDRQKGG